MKAVRHKPTVFVSSTCYDLRQTREDLKDFFENNYGFNTLLSEFDSFPIDPCKGTFENCLDNVDKIADIFVLIVGTRYGYITNNGKSITNLEYLHAKEKGIPIYVFVDKQLYNNMMVWRSNREANFSSVVDNVKVFEFVSEIYDESKQWIYTYDTVKDIQSALKQQLSLVFCDGLTLQKIVGNSYNRIVNADIPRNAVRVFVEKPYGWEFKFFAYVLKGEFDKLQSNRWDFKYGIYSFGLTRLEGTELVNDISDKLNEILGLSDMLMTLINKTSQDAIGDPGVPSNLDMMIYVSKQIASIYKRIIEWGLYFKSVQTESIFDNLLHLLSELSQYLMDQIDGFVKNVYVQFTEIPDVKGDNEYNISINCVFGEGNLPEINKEIERIRTSII